jgi:6-pyruvoyltetrahydropterin/6-carboxytetrahydropterin synthase
MKTSVTKIVKFEMAHQLDECYSEECKQIHGHGYRLEVTFEGDVHPVTGMVVDFKEVKELLQPIIARYDHKFLTKESYGKNPTAENMAMDIFQAIRQKTLMLKKVRLWETDTGYAEVSY